MRRFTLLTIIGLFVVLTAATIYQVVLVQGKPRNLVGPGLSPGPDEVILTNLIGLPRELAIDQLRDGGLRFEVTPDGDPDGNSDRVVAQDPPGGVLVTEGTLVRLTVDCMPAPCPAPPDGKQIDDPCGCGSN